MLKDCLLKIGLLNGRSITVCNCSNDMVKVMKEVQAGERYGVMVKGTSVAGEIVVECVLTSDIEYLEVKEIVRE